MAEDSVLRGSCLCGSIEVECAPNQGEVIKLVYCYCSSCRKSSGAPKLAVFPMPADAVTIKDKRMRLKGFASSRGKKRYFCGECGASIYSRKEGKKELRLRAGLFDRLGTVEFTGHIYFSGKADWYHTFEPGDHFVAKEPGRS